MCFVCISDQTAIISLYSIKLSVFITEAENVYCAVRTGSLNRSVTVSSLKGLYRGFKRRLPYLGKTFLGLNYIDVTNNVFIRSRTVTEMMAR